MFFFKFSFILTILAFFFMSATALPVGQVASAPGSLLGRTYVQRAAGAGSVPAVTAREAETGDSYYAMPAARRAPGAEASPEAFVPLNRSERFQRRVAARLNRLDSLH